MNRQGAVELSDDVVELAPAVAALARLSLSGLATGTVLQTMAGIGASLLPVADAVFVRSVETGRADLTHGSTALVGTLEDLQAQLSEGPAPDVRYGGSVQSGTLASDARWPRFGPRAGRLGARSALGVAMVHDGTPLGAITFYSAREFAFDPEQARAAESYAGYAAIALHNHQAYGRAERAALLLQAEADNRATVERAVGILMSRRGISPVEAMTALRELSQRANEKLVRVAEQLVDEAVRRARARTDAV